MARPLTVEAQFCDYLNIHYTTASRAVKRVLKKEKEKCDCKTPYAPPIGNYPDGLTQRSLWLRLREDHEI
jgi:hypothetical protein